jgi:hypothetical protein
VEIWEGPLGASPEFNKGGIMAKKKEQGSDQPEETVTSETESTASESKTGGSWKAKVNFTCKGADGNNVSIKAGDAIPSDLSKEEMEALAKDGMIEKG